MLVRLQLNELIVQSLGSIATARSLFQGRKATQSLRRIVARLSTKLQAGSSLLTCIRLILSIRKELALLKLKGTWDLHYYQLEQIKRVRLVRRADGYYVQFLISADNKVDVELTGKMIGLDVGLESFYTGSDGHTEPNPRFYRTGEKRLKFLTRRVSRKKKGSANRKRAINKLGRVHLKISRQREEHAKRLARCVIQSNHLVAYEDLRIKNLSLNHCLAKSINDALLVSIQKMARAF